MARLRPGATSVGREDLLDKAKITGERILSACWADLILSTLGDSCWNTPETGLVGESRKYIVSAFTGKGAST